MVSLIVTVAMGLSLLSGWANLGIFRDYALQAEQKLVEMTIDEKIAQILLVRYPDSGGIAALSRYQFGGYLFFAKDFAGKSTSDVQNLIQTLQNIAKIPILTAVDEEGGTVVRVSSNPKLAPSRFLAPQTLYAQGGLDLITTDTLEKSELLANLGLNLNLAPVVDVSTDPDDYMFGRSLGQDAEITAEFAETVISASQEFNSQTLKSANSQTSGSVSYTLKHFPGYGNNLDTHAGSSIDQRSLSDLFHNDLLPFRTGINAGAEAVLVSHNIVTALDSERPASLSPAVHQLLRQDLGFTGVIITDDIAMAALDSSSETTLQALLAGNDLIITSDYAASIRELKSAFNDGRLSKAQLDRAVRRVLAWKYYKGLL